MKTSPFVILPAFQCFPIPPGRQEREASTNFLPKNKGFINNVFCRKWAVRNPAGTRLDSSRLVNKKKLGLEVGGDSTERTKGKTVTMHTA